MMCQQYHKNVCLSDISVICNLRHDYAGKNILDDTRGWKTDATEWIHIPTGHLECFTLYKPWLCKDANSETYSVLWINNDFEAFSQRWPVTMFQSLDKGYLLSEYTRWANKNSLVRMETKKNTHPLQMLPCDITTTISVNGRSKIYRIPCNVFLSSCYQNPWGADLWFDKCISKNIEYTLSKKHMLQTNQTSNIIRNK